MSGTPTAAYSIRIRARLANEPGVLGRLAVAIGEVGGNIWALEGFEAKHSALDEDIIVNCSSEAHQQQVLDAVRGLDGVEILEWDDRTFAMHEGGKIEVLPLFPVGDRDDLSMAYTPGVARVCKAIEAEPERVHDLTIKKNTVAIVTDGTAVLGSGRHRARGARSPSWRARRCSFKEFAGVDGFPICLDCSSADEIVESVQRIAPVFGGINLEDIAAPQCFEVEERLKELLDIPVFHDDQHGTAVVVLAALQNALEDRRQEDGRPERRRSPASGAAGVACAKIVMEAGVPHVVGVDRKGAIWEGRDDLNPAKQWFAENTNPDRLKGTLAEVMPGADVFIGVSGPGLLQADDLDTMGRDPIVFALANPDPEIRPEDARGRAAVIATGRSDYPNQINNVLCFPGIFRGALDAGATSITENMKLAAADAIASAVGDDELAPDFVIPSVFDKRVSRLVADAVGRCGRARRCRARQLRLVTSPQHPFEAVTFDYWHTLFRAPDPEDSKGRRAEWVAAVLRRFELEVADVRLREALDVLARAGHQNWVDNRQYYAPQASAELLELLEIEAEAELLDAMIKAYGGEDAPPVVEPTANIEVALRRASRRRVANRHRLRCRYGAVDVVAHATSSRTS